MATIKPCVFASKRKQDNTYPVQIRLTWKRNSLFLPSNIYVWDDQIRRRTHLLRGRKVTTLEIKDPKVNEALGNEIRQYSNLILQLGLSLNKMDIHELKTYLMEAINGKADPPMPINFIEFSREHIRKLFEEGRNGTARPIQSVVNNLEDYVGSDFLDVTALTRNYLDGFYDSLKKPSKVTRKNQFGKLVTVTKPPVTDLKTVMTHLRTLFNAAKRKYNDEDKKVIRIVHNPFDLDNERRKSIAPKPSGKRVLTLEEMRRVRDCLPVLPREILAKDLFMLSFFCAGTNCADFYHLTDYSNGRISYSRRKVANRRQDSGFISMKIPVQAEVILEKYRDLSGKRVCSFYKMYATQENFTAAIIMGLNSLAEVVHVPRLTTYYARFTFASIAFNLCRVSKDVVDLCLDHANPASKMADKYIDKDFSLVDDAIAKVVRKLYEDRKAK